MSNSIQTLNYNLPGGLITGDTYARVRLSTAGGLSATGPAADGEVEDYLVTIVGPPRVVDVKVNHGESQRSSLTTVQVTFDRVVDVDVNGTGNDPFKFINLDTNEIVTDIPVIDNTSGVTMIDFTFDPNGLSATSFGSLKNGNYRLTVDSSLVTSFGMELDGNGDGDAGGDYVLNATDGFFRKYGDVSGNHVVDLLDFAEFRRTFGTSKGDLLYQSGIDSDGDLTIGLLDFAEFRRNFGS